MAKWKNIKSATGGTISGGIEYGGAVGESSWELYQDEKPFIEQAKMEREQNTKENIIGGKKFASIPDIVAIEVMQKYGVNIHDPEHSSCKWTMARFKQIIMKDYPYLVVNKA